MSRAAVRAGAGGGAGDDIAGGWAVLLAVCLGLGLATLASTIVNVALPAIGRNLNAGLTGLQWVANAFTLVYAALLPAAGPIGDRTGRRRLLVVGMGVFAGGALACSAAPSLAALVALRVVQAAGGAAITPVGLAIIAHEFRDPAARARAVGIWAGVASLGLAAGPVVGGVLIAHVGWRSVFWVIGGLGAVAVPLAWRLIPGARHGRPASVAPLDLAGLLLAGAFLAGLSFGLIEGHAYGWTSAPIVVAFTASASALAAFLAVERARGDAALMPLGVWRSPSFVAANVGGAVYFLSLFGILFFFSLYLQEIRGYSAIRTGLLFFPLTAVMAVLAPLAGRLVARLGVRPVVTAGFLVAGTGTVALARLPAGAGSADLLWRFVTAGMGFGLMSAPLTAAAVGSLPAAEGGLASSVYNTFRQVGAVLGVALLGAVLTAGEHADRLVNPVATHLSGTPAADVSDPGAFLAGLHAALLVAAGCLYAAAALGLALLRSDRSSAAPAPIE